MWHKSLIAIALAGTLVAGARSSAAPSAAPTPVASTTVPRSTATICLWHVPGAKTYVGRTLEPSAISMSDDGWCWTRFFFRFGTLPKALGMPVSLPPRDGIVQVVLGPNNSMLVGYKPNPGFSGTDHMTLIAVIKHVFTYPFILNVAGSNDVFASEPPPHGLPKGKSVLVADTSCPTGQVDQVTGGVPRQHVCLPVPK